MKRRALLLSPFAAGLAACGSPPTLKASDGGRLGEKAVAVISVTHDAAVGRRVHAIFNLDPSTLTNRLLRSVEPVVPGIVSGTSDFEDAIGHVYVMDLSPGEHRIDGWHVHSDSQVSLQPRIKPPALTFRVNAGDAIYLGNLHMRMDLGRSMGGMPMPTDALPMLRDRRDVDLRIAESKVPGLRDRVMPALLMKPGPWTPAPAGGASL
jgi:hypothetical protein